MNGEREVKTGIISVSKSSFLKLPQLFYAVANIYRFPNPARTWISRCCTLYDKTNSSPAKIQITDELNHGSEFKTLILENVCAIQKKASKSKNYKVEIHWRKESFSFAVDHEHEANSWIDHLNDVAEFDQKSGKKISVENLWRTSSVSENDEVYVYNLDYQSLDMWTYDVEMNDTDASLHCQLSGSYRLQLTKQGFFLLTFKERRVLYQWPYHFIRRYGKSQNTFTIQAGRKCDSGEGSFCFKTKTGESLEIFQRVNQLTLQLKATQNELASENAPAAQNVAKSARNSGAKKTLLSPQVEVADNSPTTESHLWAKKALPYQIELQNKLFSHSDKYSNVNIRKLPSPEPQKTKLPPVFKPQNVYSDVEPVTGQKYNLPTEPNLTEGNYSSIEVNNNHGSQNVPSQSAEENYDRLNFNIIETPFEERQKNFQPYIYDSVVIKNEDENLYEEATSFTDQRNACGGKLPPVPIVITHKPFMAPATVDDGYR